MNKEKNEKNEAYLYDYNMQYANLSIGFEDRWDPRLETNKRLGERVKVRVSWLELLSFLNFFNDARDF